MKTKTRNRPQPEAAPQTEQAPGSTATGPADDILNALRTGGEALRSGGSVLYPHRRGAAPTVATGALWGLGAILSGVPGEVLAGVPAAPAYTALSGAALLGLTFARPVLHWLRVNTPGQALWARATVAAGTGWLTAAAAVGVDEPAPLALIAGGLAVSAPWWYHYRQRITLPAPAPIVESKEVEVYEPPVDLIWDTKVACPGGPLAHAEVEGWYEVPYGRSTGVWLPDNGKLMNEEAVGMTVRVTTSYRKRIGEVIIEPHPDCIEGHLQVTILDKAPVEDGRIWGGPNLDALTGIMPLGLFADGKGEAKIQLFKPGVGMKHVLVSGGTGSGKSNFLANLIAAIEHSGVGVTWLADPQGGQSIPDWADENALDRVALDMESIKIMIQAAYEVMMSNSEYLVNLRWTDAKGRERKGKKCMDPTPEMKFLALVIDEAHKVLADPEIAKIVADIAKMGRKAGVVLILATQTPTQDELGGQYGGPIRDNILMGNIVVLRTKSRMTGGMLSLPVDPAKLPAKFANGDDTNGIGFVIGETERPVMMRVDYDEDPYQWVLTSPHPKLHKAAQDAAFAVFDNPGAYVAQGSDGAFATPARLASISFLETANAEPEADRQERVLARERVLTYLNEKGPAMRIRIKQDLGLSATHVQRVLNDLVAEHKLTNDGTGLYAIPGTEVLEEASV